jgi:hypothetical protein
VLSPSSRLRSGVPGELGQDPERQWLNRKLDALPHDPVAAAAAATA